MATIRHETSKANMTLCSFSDVYYVYGRPFLKLLYRLGHRHKTDAVMTEYDLPCWQIEFFHTGGLSVRQRKKLLDEKKSFDEWMQRIFREPENVTEKKEEIRVQVADKLTQAAESVRMTLRDHIILADEQYYSFAENKKL